MDNQGRKRDEGYVNEGGDLMEILFLIVACGFIIVAIARAITNYKGG